MQGDCRAKRPARKAPSSPTRRRSRSAAAVWIFGRRRAEHDWHASVLGGGAHDAAGGMRADRHGAPARSAAGHGAVPRRSQRSVRVRAGERSGARLRYIRRSPHGEAARARSRRRAAGDIDIRIARARALGHVGDERAAMRGCRIVARRERHRSRCRDLVPGGAEPARELALEKSRGRVAGGQERRARGEVRVAPRRRRSINASASAQRVIWSMPIARPAARSARARTPRRPRRARHAFAATPNSSSSTGPRTRSRGRRCT